VSSDAPSDTGTDILRIESFSVSYGSSKVVNDISLSVNRGEIVGILGPNGAGKTSLLRALTGNATWSGRIFFNGVQMKTLEDYFPNVAIAPQMAGLYPYLSARENIRLINLMTARDSTVNQSVDKALELVDLSTRSDDPVSMFSGGMRQRLNFAVSVANNPLLLFLDEPAAGVDVHARQCLNKAMRAHVARDAGIILVTHEHDEAEMICDRVAVLIEGECVAFDCPSRLIGNYIPEKYEARITLRCAISPDVERTLGARGFIESNPGEWRALKHSDQEALTAYHLLTDEIGESAASLTIQHVTLSSLMRKLTHDHNA